MGQLIKFGFVGGLCFLIDFVIATVLFHFMNGTFSKDVATLTGGFTGFTVSVIVNYILSMKFVFERREDMNRRTEFIIFIVLSVIGLGLNEVILLICGRLYDADGFMKDIFMDTMWFAASKIVATAIVMIYNFVTRKLFLEKK